VDRGRLAGRADAARAVAAETPEGMPSSNIMFYSDNVEQTYAELTAKGVKFPTAPTKMFFGWWSVFEDDEGTRHALGEQWGTNQ
jgi:lactoylglutathione lyase